MTMPLLLRALFVLFFTLISGVIPPALTSSSLPDVIYGVNIGSWLVFEPWMVPETWTGMGGEWCSPCSECIGSEFALAKAYPDTVDELLDEHWSSWFTQDDVDKLSSYGINLVRIPLGYWIVEGLVNRSSEYYPRGGIKYLKTGLGQLNAAGIKVILDHHALPGAQNTNVASAGRCTSEPEFYTDENYHRALVWTAVMTALSHLDSDFGSVVAIEAANEPERDYDTTPGYGDFQKNFVEVVRAVETLLSVWTLDTNSSSVLLDNLLSNTTNMTVSLLGVADYGGAVGEALVDAAPLLAEVVSELGVSDILTQSSPPSTSPLLTTLMDVSWQYNDSPNPADAAIGPQLYDTHLYYGFGGVANATEDAYLTSVCNLARVQTDTAKNNTPLVFGEWSLSTEFTATDEFLKKWADAQKKAYAEGAGWIFWNFKMGNSTSSGTTTPKWSYYAGIEEGYFTADPSAFNDDSVCDSYNTASTKKARMHRARAHTHSAWQG